MAPSRSTLTRCELRSRCGAHGTVQVHRWACSCRASFRREALILSHQCPHGRMLSRTVQGTRVDSRQAGTQRIKQETALNCFVVSQPPLLMVFCMPTICLTLPLPLPFYFFPQTCT